MRIERHRDGLAHRAARIERGAWILEHHLHAPAMDTGAGGAGDAFPVDPDLAYGRGFEAHDHTGDGRFAGAALAGQAIDRAARYREADIIDRADLAGLAAERIADRKEFRKVADFQHRCAHGRASAVPNCMPPVRRGTAAIRLRV
jgi:hypothetical protein